MGWIGLKTDRNCQQPEYGSQHIELLRPMQQMCPLAGIEKFHERRRLSAIALGSGLRSLASRRQGKSPLRWEPRHYPSLILTTDDPQQVARGTLHHPGVTRRD